MNRKSLRVVALVLAIVAALGAVYGRRILVWQSSSREKQGSKSEAAQRRVLYYYDAMNPQNHYDKPGKAPDGMDLVPQYADESTRIYRELSLGNPALRIDYAQALAQFGSILGLAGQTQTAGAACREAIGLFKDMNTTDPVVALPFASKVRISIGNFLMPLGTMRFPSSISLG